MVGKGRQGSGGHEVRRADGLQNQVMLSALTYLLPCPAVSELTLWIPGFTYTS